MKRTLYTLLLVAGLMGTAMADIQAPPASEYTASRKLGRAISNLIYAVEEIPTRMIYWNSNEGDYAGFSVGLVDGTGRMIQRMGYGIYELVTFWAPTYKCTYKPPYQGSCGQSGYKEYNPSNGFSEFPSELGFQSYYRYSRTQLD
jgi:putative exosortase-associated protein (TIGR04073 family)